MPSRDRIANETRMLDLLNRRRITEMLKCRWAAWLAALLSLNLATTVAAQAPAARAQFDFFEQRVRPVLATKCFSCHGPKKQEGGLRLDSRMAVIKGSENGPVVVPGKPDASLLVEAIGYAGGVQMPPDGRLSQPEIVALTEWIRQGV